MAANDPIANMLIKTRNVNIAKHNVVGVPTSKAEVATADILVNEGYVEKHELVENEDFQGTRIALKCGATRNDRILSDLKRISKPSFRICAGREDTSKVLGGLGTAIISTDQDVIADKEAHRLGAGGEVLVFIW